MVEACANGVCVVGSSSTVLVKLSTQLYQLPAVNYMVCQMAWSCLTHDQEIQSLELFRQEVMPALAE